MFLTLMLLRDERFVGEPLRLIGTMIHDTRDGPSHDQFLQVVFNAIPCLRKATARRVGITDRELAILNALALVGVASLCCWNHLYQDVKRHVSLYMAYS